MAGSIAYIMSRFPHLPETFILRELIGVQQRGWNVALYPLILQREQVVHAEAEPWVARAHKLPYLSGRLVLDNLRALVGRPRRYLSMVGGSLWENRRSPNFLLRALAILPRAAYVARLMRQQGIQHMHAHFASHPALLAWVVHKLTGISYSITVHAHDIFVRTAMLATKLRDAKFIVAISDYNREHLARTIGPWVREKTHVIRCGIEPERYERQHARPGPGEPLELLSIGSLQPYKGQTHLVEACAILRRRGIPFRCRIIGEGEERAQLTRQIAAAQLDGQVELLGGRPQAEVAALLPTAHCYVQPSIITPEGKMEGIPVALMEALACELPVVASAISGIPELVQPDRTGLLVPAADPAALADAIGTVYNHPEEAARLAAAGRALVLEEFTLDRNVTALTALFDRQI